MYVLHVCIFWKIHENSGKFRNILQFFFFLYVYLVNQIESLLLGSVKRARDTKAHLAVTKRKIERLRKHVDISTIRSLIVDSISPGLIGTSRENLYNDNA